ncbi:hypothetical protein DM02DRAFT_639732 [Periconia macrospinosa]|uniref:BTB domain-containing protein n=1 Tax=Periconia macrospinosa TaxID=97972 RepID=A0A2V1E6E1_9PLEO|nr:hypothetical protein DM02DRAFT_639732 [Periconia macrospinosa]
MAPPLRADTTTARRPVPRVIPAIPRRFARPPTAARPITPDESTTTPAALTPTPQRVEEKKPERAATPVQTPPTPESKASPSVNGDGEEQKSENSSTPSAHEDRMREAAVADTLAPHSATPNGHRPKSTVRTELPPEFYPREKPPVHSPFSDGRDAPSMPPPHHMPIHRFQPSVEGIVFGGAVQESPAMPSTPQEVESDIRAPQPTFARPPPGFAPHLAPQFFPGHSHHPSDPNTSWLQPAYSMGPPPEVIYGNGQDYTSPTFSPGSAPFQAPFPAPFPPPNAPLAHNGTISSHSQSPSKSQFGEAKPAPYVDEESAIPYTNGTASRQFEAPSEIYDIVRHVFGFFGNPEFTDYILHVRLQETVLLSMPVHAAIVSRSPIILEAIRRSASPAFQTKDPRRLAEVVLEDMFVSSESLHEAVKILYGAPLLSPHSFLFGLNHYHEGSEKSYESSEARRRLTQVISYIASGRNLQIPEMQACGFRIAKALLRWDTIDELLYFCLTETYAAPLLNDVLGFLAYNFPFDFSLYSLAPELRQYPRLPTVTEPKQTSHNPRLSKIRFGDAPLEDEAKPTHITQVLSSILLTIPLHLLDQLFNHPVLASQISRNNLTRIMRDVIDERERRREKVLKAQFKPSPDGSVPHRLLENLHKKETMEVSKERPLGFALTANRQTESL